MLVHGREQNNEDVGNDPQQTFLNVLKSEFVELGTKLSENLCKTVCKEVRDDIGELSKYFQERLEAHATASSTLIRGNGLQELVLPSIAPTSANSAGLGLGSQDPVVSLHYSASASNLPPDDISDREVLPQIPAAPSVNSTASNRMQPAIQLPIPLGSPTFSGHNSELDSPTKMHDFFMRAPRSFFAWGPAGKKLAKPNELPMDHFRTEPGYLRPAKSSSNIPRIRSHKTCPETPKTENCPQHTHGLLPSVVPSSACSGSDFDNLTSDGRSVVVVAQAEEKSLLAVPTKHTATGMSYLMSAFGTGRATVSDSECNRNTESVHGWRGFQLIKAIVDSDSFEQLCAVVIFLFTIAAGIEADYSIGHPGKETERAVQLVDLSFYMLLLVEVALRLIAYRRDFFFGPNYGWNIFDSVLVISFVSKKIVTTAFGLEYAILRAPPFAFYARILRAFRIVRIVSLPRAMRYLKELRAMIASLVNSIRFLLWTCVVLLLMTYLMAAHVTIQVAYQKGDDPSALSENTDLYANFGSFGRTFLTCYQCVIGGDWTELTKPLDFNETLVWQFCVYMAMSYLFILNVASGFFVDAAVSSAKSEKDFEMVSKLREVFCVEDDDGDGCVSWEEFEHHMGSPEMQWTFEAIDLDLSEARNLFQLLDLDGSGTISVEEFVNGCLRLRGSAKSIDIATLMYEGKRTARHVCSIPDQLHGLRAKIDTSRLYIEPGQTNSTLELPNTIGSASSKNAQPLRIQPGQSNSSQGSTDLHSLNLLK